MTSSHETNALRQVLLAAQRLLEAREDQMITAEEWEALADAVNAATQRPDGGPGESFAVDATSGALLRRVVPKRGQPYEHMCTKQVFDDVAYAIEQMGNAAFTMEEIRAKVGGGDEASMPPWSQVATAVAFLKERGCIVPARQRKNGAASDFVYEDALIEYHALRHKGPEEAAPSE
ncbi:MAG: hypothetical protein IT430_18845 [Phycisphaerales bacterium]|nr:hypothetical protein [Phycisphaerales bacterium]